MVTEAVALMCAVATAFFVPNVEKNPHRKRPDGYMMHTPIIRTVALAFIMMVAPFQHCDAGRGPAIKHGKEFKDGQWCLEGKRYTTIVPVVTLKHSPGWIESDQNPPVSVRSAFAAAKEMLRKDLAIEDNTEAYWRPVRAEVSYYGWRNSTDDREGQIWYWRVIFEKTIRKGAQSGLPVRIDCVVLMNGKAVVPHVENIAEGDQYCTDDEERDEDTDAEKATAR